jgi:16S rRNA (uracil1498-N3)-methyltransferase
MNRPVNALRFLLHTTCYRIDSPMTVRYFVPEIPTAGGQITLPDAESHHASQVMRVRQGDQVVVFDGQGNEAFASIVSVARKGVVCEAAPREFLPRDNPATIAIAVAMPKGDRARELVERLTELGVDRLIPIHCQRSPWEISAAAIQKWQRVMIEACKQCRRNRFMQITPPVRVDDFLIEAQSGPVHRWFAHPGGGSAIASAENGEAHRNYRIAIGPEGGFTDRESDVAISSGWMPIGLGERIYRIETAAVILAVKASGI